MNELRDVLAIIGGLTVMFVITQGGAALMLRAYFKDRGIEEATSDIVSGEVKHHSPKNNCCLTEEKDKSNE